MKESNSCPKCSSDKVMYPLETMGYPTDSVKVVVTPKRSLLSLNLPSTFSLQAAVCGNCGYTELYVADPASIYEKWNAAN